MLLIRCAMYEVFQIQQNPYPSDYKQMKLKKTSSIDYVHQFSDLAYMKFKPNKLNLKIEQQKPQQQNPFMSRIKSFIRWRQPQPIAQSRATQNSGISKTNSKASMNSVPVQADAPGTKMIFLQKMTSEHFLIGNQNQIDLVFIGGIVGNFIDTQSLWQLNIGRPIKNLAIDVKKGHIAIETTTQIVIYLYDNKKIKQRPQFLTGIKTKSEGKYLRFIRDSVLAVFYNNFIEVYIIEENKMRRKMCKEVKEAAQMQLFQVPMPVENSLNIFYIRKSGTSKTFQLWYLQMHLRGFQIDLTGLMKVYDVKEGLQKKIKLENFSKQIFLMNLGFEILAVKKGYIIDSAYLNIRQESTFLRYIGNNRLLHLSPQKAEVYRFKIDFTSNPPHIDIISLDSIQIKKPKDYEYIGSLQMYDRNIAVFYQIAPRHNKRTKGEITYCFAITRHVTVDEKIREIFTFDIGKQVKDVSIQLIEERVDIAQKIGLSRTEIYLELWNRTNKTTVEEFKFLLDTLNYGTIKNEIQKKMKKSSMLWREVYKIEQSCFQMIRENLFSPRCTEDVVKEFLTSHFLLRKLQMYRDITLAERKSHIKNKEDQQEGDTVKINIQNYNKYSKADIKTLFLQLISEYCIEGKDVLVHIRIFLKLFRFIFRIIYKQLLQDIISTSKHNLIKLLQNFPELLPYKHILSDDDDQTLYEGVWEDISRLEWEKNLHVESIITIDNREVISQIPNSLWFRRNFLTLHDMTGKSKEQILKINKSNNSDEIFYFFISKVFEHIQQEEALSKIISFVQRNYQKMPVHIHEKIFLYRKIFIYFRDNELTKNNEKLKNFHDLLQMKDYELFKEFFQVEKVKKGCLLKDIKDIYGQVGGQQEVMIESSELLDYDGDDQEYRKFRSLARGTVWFNQGILSYFSSELSQISDLKYILNRVNNAKIQFFIQNQHLIYVLVKSCQLKIRIGSSNDIPIDEIMLYLQNIPLTKGSPVLHQLTRIQKINQQVQRFQEIKINMTISQITKNCENVINALINQEIKKRKVMEITSMQEMTSVSYDILAQIQVIKQKIYTLQYSDLTFFVYLTKIMQQVHMIPYADQLLKDPFLQQHYSINDVKVVEDLILYMYKMKLSENPNYIQNQYYLTNLLQILPEDNQCRIYIHCELQYAKMLSAPNNPVEYPITDKLDGITIVQLEERIQQLPGEFLLTIDIEKLHTLMNTMQQICYQDVESGLYTTLNEIYEIIILKLIEDSLILQSIQLVKRLLKLPNNQYEAIFPLFYIDLISQQLTVECKKLLLRAVSFLFNQPMELLQIVEKLIGKVFSNRERDEYFRDLAAKSQELRRNYNPKNPILDPIYLQLIRNQEMQNNFRSMIDQCSHHLVKTKEEFNTFEFSLLFIMLVQQPFALGKYIFCRRYHINYKVMRSFLSYIIKEEIFSSIRVLQFGKRLFNIVLQASQSFLPFESIASQYSNISLEENIQFQDIFPLEPILPSDDQFTKKAKMLQSKLQKCIIAFERKKLSVLTQLTTRAPLESIDKKKQRIERQLTNPVDLSEKAPSQYPFGDSDDDYGQEQKFDDLMTSIRRKKAVNQFNPSLQRNLLMNRTSKNYALFMSTKFKDSADNTWMSARGITTGGPNRKPQGSPKPLAMDRSPSLQFSCGEPVTMQENKPKKRSNGNMFGRFREDINFKFAQSVQDNTFGMTKSAVVKHRGTHMQRVYTPQADYQQNDSIEYNEYDQQHDYFLNQQTEDKQRQEEAQQIIEDEDNDTGMQFQVRVQQVDEDAFMPVNKIKSMIVDSVSEEGDQFYVDLSQLDMEKQKNPSEFNNYLVSLVKQIYNDSQINPKTRLRLIKDIDNYYPDIGISKDYLEIYIRFESYHSKYDIPILINEMFPVDFLFTDHKDAKHLFDLVSQKIVHLVDESNIYKISKIIHLAFKASSFEQQFFFAYLCMAAQKFDKEKISQNQLNMQLEKLTALIEKLPIHIITVRGRKMIEKMTVQERKDKIIIAMVNCLGKKKSPQQVRKFEQSLNQY